MCSELVDYLLSPQGPHVFHEVTWRRLVRKTSKSGTVFYFLLNDGLIPLANNGRPISTLFTTMQIGQYWPHRGDSPPLTPKEGCARCNGGLPRDWEWGGWPQYRAQLSELGILDKETGESTFFCANEQDVRKALKEQLENLPQAYSAESVRQNFQALRNEQRQIDLKAADTFKAVAAKLSTLAQEFAKDPALYAALAAKLTADPAVYEAFKEKLIAEMPAIFQRQS